METGAVKEARSSLLELMHGGLAASLTENLPCPFF
jgi:hypothetical protein